MLVVTSVAQNVQPHSVQVKTQSCLFTFKIYKQIEQQMNLMATSSTIQSPKGYRSMNSLVIVLTVQQLQIVEDLKTFEHGPHDYETHLVVGTAAFQAKD